MYKWIFIVCYIRLIIYYFLFLSIVHISNWCHCLAVTQLCSQTSFLCYYWQLCYISICYSPNNSITYHIVLYNCSLKLWEKKEETCRYTASSNFLRNYIYPCRLRSLSNVMCFQPKTLLRISSKSSLPSTSYLSFCLSGNSFISPLFLKDSFAGYQILSFLSSFRICHPIAFWYLSLLMRS